MMIFWFPSCFTCTQIERVITLVGLETQRDTYAKKLSGGQKRKLSVGIAILGDPKVSFIFNLQLFCLITQIYT